MEKNYSSVQEVKLVGGSLCLDFTNTVGGRRGSEVVQEKLNSYADLIAWSGHAGLLTDTEARRLMRQAAQSPVEANEVLERAIALREALYRIFTAQVHNAAPKPADLALLNAELSNALARSEITVTEAGFTWDWSDQRNRLDRVLWPIVRSAADLLTSGDLDRVRECAGDACGWLFVDTSKNHSRRWCDMSDCGNRAKARRHYARARAAPLSKRSFEYSSSRTESKRTR
ncbi:MAG: ABATE domain-containing protein [Pyrinomonadaceae bacterium]|nr:ABATE domain-containing protein [Pyrinomonadaceae bacterium]